MDTMNLKGVTFRTRGLSAEGLAYLEQKMRRIKRRKEQAESLYFRLLSAVLPSDYRNVPVESYVQGTPLVIGCGGGLECISMGAVGIDVDLPLVRIAADLSGRAAETRAAISRSAAGCSTRS